MKTKPQGGEERTPEGDFRSALVAAVSEFDLEPLSERAISLLALHFDLLSGWNRKSNLTRITGVADAARLHYAESIYAAQFIQASASLLDNGSGAGFPAVPIAVVRPNVQVTALEPNLKKNVFLKEAKDALALENLHVIRARLESFDWSACQFITTRAVERASELALSIVKGLAPGQNFLLFCAQDLKEMLSARFRDEITIDEHPVPLTRERLVLVIRKE